MQETKTRTPAEDLPPPRPPWIRAVAMVAAVAMLGGVLYATWQATAGNEDPGPDPTGPGTSDPDFSLTDDQAIARFEELDELRVRAYETADVGMVSNIAGPGPFKNQMIQELRQLKRDDVTTTLELETEQLRVESNTSEQVDLQQTVVTNIRFFDSSGTEVTDRGKPERWVINWTLQNFDSRWLISRSEITETDALK